MKSLFTLLFSLLIYCSSCTQPFTPGSKIEVEFGGRWHQATILAIKGDEYSVRYQGEGQSFDIVVPKNRVRAVADGETDKPANAYEKGAKVQANMGGFLKDAIITDFKDGKYKVHFEGYGDAYDDWFTADQLQLVNKTVVNDAEKTPITEAPATVNSGQISVGSKIEAQQGGAWFPATVKEIKDGEYLVKYDNYDEQEWVTANKLRAKSTLAADKLAATDGKVYVRSLYDVISGYYEISWWFFGDNGVVVWNPVHGVNPINLPAEQADNFNKVGNYNNEGPQVKINWLTGYQANYKAEYKNGDFETLDGGLMVRQKPLSDNYRLQGSYTGTTKSQSISSANTYVFGNDGMVSVNKAGYVNAGDFAGKSDETKNGTYVIKGYTLFINYDDGTKETSLIGIISADKLIINTRSFSPN